MKKFLALCLMLTMVFSLSSAALAATAQQIAPLAGQEGDSADEAAGYDMDYYTKYKGQNLSVNVFNWGEYISNGDDDSLDVNAAFEELTGIKVVYSTFDTNESLYAKLRTGGSSYDVIIPSDYLIARMIEEDMLSPINLDNVPNFKNIDGQYVNPDYDPQNRYSVPYTWGTVGLIYNTTMIEPGEDMGTWGVLWNEKYKGNILMFGNSRDAFGIAFKLLGYPINANSPEQIREATNLLKKQKPLLQSYVMDEIFDKMTGGEAAMAPYYAGDFITMHEDNPDLAFSFPREGTNIFTDAMCIPKDAKNQELGEMYINFMLEPDIGLANIEYIGYSTPNSAVFELLDEEIQNDPIRYPPAEQLAEYEYFVHVSGDIALAMDEAWTEIVSSDEQYGQLLMPMLLGAAVLVVVVVAVMRSRRKKRPQG